MFKVGTMLKAREVRLSRKKPPYHPALIPGTRLVANDPKQAFVRFVAMARWRDAGAKTSH